MDRYSTDELTLAEQVAPSLRKGMLCLADRFFPSYSLWQTASRTGADLLWRVRKNARLDWDERLPDGSYLSRPPQTGAISAKCRARSDARSRLARGRRPGPVVVSASGAGGPEANDSIRRHSPRQRNFLHEIILDEILEERVSSSRNRVNPRGVKRKMSSYPFRPRKRRTRRIDFSSRIRIVK